jgi:hypothetical protein
MIGKSYVRLEKELFIGFYAIRKLLDTFKVSDLSRSLTFDLACYQCIGNVDYLNSHKIDELYDLDSIGTESRDINFLSNQFIHSYIFVPVLGEKAEITGVFVSSDWMRQKKLYFVAINQVLSAFRTIGKDNPSHVHMSRNPLTNQWEGTVT